MNLSRMMVAAALVAVLVLPAAAEAAKPKQQYYVSLGDSYATGFQPTAVGQGANTRNGFAYKVPKLAKRKGYRYKLVNFGCGGETTVSLLERTSECGGLGPGGKQYTGRTQIAAAERFIRRHRAKVGLITVSIGGNDVTRCARDANPIPCVAAAVEAIKANVSKIAARLRKAGGKKVRIVGTTYPDVILGQWVGENPNQDLAKLSVVAFKELINPELEKAYASAGGKLVDVTAATGAYGPFEETTTLEPYGVIPVPVAKACEYSFYCEFRDIHARTIGYKLIAELIVGTLPRRKVR
jgi:lysophospholipase L1-like esterase